MSDDMRAADGGTLPVHRYFDQMIAHLEDGDLNNDLSEAVQDIVSTLQTHVLNHGGKPKGTLTLKLEFKLAGASFEIKPTVAKVTPEAPRGTAHLWATPGGLLTPVNPKQMQMFSGPRPVHPAAAKANDEREDA
ncbi:MAG: hypothetical protein P1U65_07690 [Minwuia sp.]|nr:hypothetical protein [Minwuia sp.]